jgi:hypothetical protein
MSRHLQHRMEKIHGAVVDLVAVAGPRRRCSEVQLARLRPGTEGGWLSGTVPVTGIKILGSTEVAEEGTVNETATQRGVRVHVRAVHFPCHPAFVCCHRMSKVT